MVSQLIGRDVELEQLGAWVAATRAGEGRIVLIRGEAGVGKTALARAALADTRFSLLEAACAEAGGQAYAPLTAILRSGFRKHAFRLSEAPALRRCLATLLPELGPTAEPAHDPALLFEAIGAALAEMATGAGLALLIDDVHWADSASIDALGYLADLVARLPVILLLTYRTEEVSRSHPVRLLRSGLRRRGHLFEVTLEPLDTAGTAALMASRLGQKPSRRLVELVHDRTEGLPFFVEEVSAALLESRSLHGEADGLELAVEDGLPLPDTVREAVLQRVDRLPEPLRDAIEVAAVAGAEFDAALVDGSQLAETALIVEPSAGRLAFRHPLIWSSVYESIPWARRQALHRELALRLEQTGAAAATLARHWLAAGDDSRARRWLLAAAREAHEACAYKDAAGHLGRALERWPAAVDPSQRLEVLEFLATCAELGGMPGIGVRALLEAIGLLEGGGDSLRLAGAQRRLAALHELQGAWERALSCRQLAADAYLAAGRADEAAAERLAVAAKLRSAASFAAALTVISAGQAEATASGRRDLLLRLRGLEGNVMARAGDGGAGIAVVRSALADALAAGDFATAAEVYQRLADSLEHAGDYRAARATYSEAAVFCRSNGADAVGDVCLACLTMVLRQTGDWDEAVAVAREVLASPSSNAHAQAVAHGVLGSILFHRGGNTRARAEIHACSVLARRIGLAAMEMDSETSLARLAAAEGRSDEALERGWRALRRWEQTDGERHYSIPSLRWIATLAAEAEAADLLKACTAAVTTIVARPDPETRAAAAHVLAEGLLAQGDAAAAVTRFQQAAALLGELGLPFERAEVERRAAVALALAGQRPRAIESFRSAHRAAVRLGARPLAMRIAAEVAALGEKVERRLGRLAAFGVGRAGLSPRELEVVRLVAGGLTTREVAAELTLSPRTVEMHVQHALTKLDCRSRIEITRKAAELGLLA